MNLPLPRLSLFAAFLLLSFSNLPAESLVQPKPFLRVADGDTVVFVGDSITHQALYTQYVENFFYTRYPERRIRFHNAGVSGDRAGDALARFSDDVASHQPAFVTVLLGMNDGKYEPFTPGTFAEYSTGVEELLGRIEQLEAEPVLLSPTMFDHHQLALRKADETFRFRERPFDGAYNSLMAYYGAWLREQAGKRQVPFVNLWGPLNDLTFAMRRSEPDFTLVEDAIHPGAAGQFVMAFSILSASQQERRGVSSITIQKRGERWIAGRNESISDLAVARSGEEISFIHLAKALPWVAVEPASTEELRWGPSAPARVGYELTKAGHKLSAERFRVNGLPEGSYELRIDDVLVGTFTHLQVEATVELQKYDHTPQSQQAIQVAELNRTRNDEAVRPMRGLWSRIKGLRGSGNRERFEKELPALMEKIGKLQAQAAVYEEQIYEAARPMPRHYRLTRVDPDSSGKGKTTRPAGGND